MNCPVCGNKGELTFRKYNYNILRCSNCKHFYTDLSLSPDTIKEIYSDHYFNGGGDGYEDYKREKDILVLRGEYYARKIGKFTRPGTVLDVGAAAGFILKGFENQGWKGTGIEPNESMVDYGRGVLGLDMIMGTLETVRPTSKFDLVVMVQVIAHLFDLKLSMERTIASLKPGGYLMIETWNKDSLTSKIFGKNWHEYSPPTTLNYFSKKSLDILMERHKFSKITSGWPQKKILGNHAKSLLKHVMKDSLSKLKIAGIVELIPDNVHLPYPAEDLFWALYKKPI